MEKEGMWRLFGEECVGACVIIDTSIRLGSIG